MSEKNTILLRTIHRDYIRGRKVRLTEPEYFQIVKLWGEIAIEMMVQGKDIKLPFGLSTIGIRKRKRAYSIDYQESRKQKKAVFVPNVRSEGYASYLYWRRKYTTFKSKGWNLYKSVILGKAMYKVMIQRKGHTVFLQRVHTTMKKNRDFNRLKQ